MKRFISGIVILSLLLAVFRLPAYAGLREQNVPVQEGKTEEESVKEAVCMATPSEAEAEEPAAPEELPEATPSDAAALTAASDRTALSKTGETNVDLSEDGILSMVKSGLKDLARIKGGDAAGWLADQFLDMLFPEVADVGDVQSQLDKVLDNQAKMLSSMEDIKSRITSSDFQTKLDNYKAKSLMGTAVKNAWQTLENIDKTYTDPEARKAERIHALTDGIGIHYYDDANTDLDKYVDELTVLITMPYYCTLSDGRRAQLDLAAMHYEYMRLDPQYLFEHEAYDQLIRFQAYVYGNYMQAATVQMLSLSARMELCREQGKSTENLKTAMDTLADNIETVEAVLAKTNVARQDVYRYFWVPGYEVKMYVQTNLKVRPRETKYSYYGSKKTKIPKHKEDLGKNWKNSLGFADGKIDSEKSQKFWNEFWTYHPQAPTHMGTGSVNCLTGKDYDNIIKGAASRQKSRAKADGSLYDLLFGPGKLKISGVSTSYGLLCTNKGDPFIFLNDASYPFTAHQFDRDCYSVTQKCVGDVAISTKYSTSTIDFGDYVTDWRGHYYAFQDKDNEFSRFILIAKYESNEEEEGVFETYKYSGSLVSVPVDYRAELVAQPAVTPVVPAANGNQLLGTAVISYAPANLTDDEKKAVIENAFWSKDDKGYWYLTGKDGGRYKNCWVLVSDQLGSNPIGNASWYYLGQDGAMLTGWQNISENGRSVWYYFNKEAGSLFGACLRGGTTPDGYMLNEKGEWIP